jgi:hypothetical protein
MNLVLFLCADYNTQISRFCQFVNEQLGVSAIMIVDNNEKDYSQCTQIEIFQVSDEECVGSGFQNCFSGLTNALVKKNPIALDKALYYLSKKQFEKAIILEEDCLVLNPKIFNKFFKTEFDLLVPSHNQRIGTYTDWHWSSIEKCIEPPYFYSMVCCFGLSQALFQKVLDHKNKIGSFFYAEAMFNTIAHQNNLIIKTPKELASVVAMGNWSMSEFRIFRNNIFHPVKDIERHNYYRFMNLVELTYCLEQKPQVICPVPYQQVLIPQFLKR